MSRRIEIELTSARDDGSWTWRAAGARQPKGDVDGTLVPAGAKTGDVLRADVETSLDGTAVLAVLPPKGARREPERIELLGRPEPEQLVTTTLAPKRGGRDRGDRGDRRDRDDRGRGGRDRGPRPDRGDRPRGERPAGDRDRTGRPARDGDGRGPRPDGADRRDRGPRRDRPAPADAKPRPKRLRPGRAHRKAVLESLPEEQRPVAEQVLRGGIPAVRQAVDKQNEQAKAEGKPEVKPDQLVDLAEQLLPRLRTAEWHDRAEAALADIDELDLRDLRSVIVAADSAAKDDDTKALATQLREGLARRVEAEQTAWLAEIASTLTEGRVVRALRLSSRPPKAGMPLPTDLADRLVEATQSGLADDTPQERWATVLDALSFSPVHARVVPASRPAEPSAELLEIVKRTSSQLPQIAALFGVEVTAPPPVRRRPGGRGGSAAPRGGAAPKGKGGPKEGRGPKVPPPPPMPAAAPVSDGSGGTAEATPEAAPAAPAETPAPEVTEAAPEAAVPAEAAPAAPGEPEPAAAPAAPAVPVAEVSAPTEPEAEPTPEVTAADVAEFASPLPPNADEAAPESLPDAEG